MAKTENSKMAVGKLRDYLQSTKGTRAPILHKLKTEDNYIKNMYFKALCMVQGYDPDGTEEQTFFLQRLLAGSDTEYDLLTYMRQGREMTSEEYEELVGQLTEKGLEYNFALDVLLIAGLGSGNDEMIQFVAELCESLRIEEMEIKFLVNVTAAILRQDYSSCVILECDRPEHANSNMWIPYVIHIEDKVIFENTGGQWSLIATNSKGVNLADYGEVQKYALPSSEVGDSYNIPGIMITGSIACLYNLEINLVSGIFFEGFDRIDFVNCKFNTDRTKEYSYGAVSICFSNCKKVKIVNCVFQDFRGRTIYVENTPNIKIENSSFIRCKMKYWAKGNDWSELGGVIHGNSEKDLLELTRCQFVECGGINGSNYYRSSIISNCQMQIVNCIFDNCWHYYDSNREDSSDSRRCLFRHIVSESGNELINSAELGLH